MGRMDVRLFVKNFLYVVKDLNDADSYVVPMQSNYMHGLNKEQGIIATAAKSKATSTIIATAV